MYHSGQPTTELIEEHRRMKRRLSRLRDLSSNTPHRKVPAFSKMEMEVLESNISALERRNPGLASST